MVEVFKSHWYSIIIIILFASILRLVNLTHADTLSDEANYGFRAVRYIDYDHEPVTHSTPAEWLDPENPYWLHIAFHDAPPVFFLIQHSSFKLFGENRFSLRFPSAVFGVGSVLLTIIVANQLFNRSVGLLAGTILALSPASVYISRIGLIESTLVFFILLTYLLFIKATQNKKYFLAVGVTLGLALLTKYTAIAIVPVFLVWIFLYKRSLFRSPYIWLGFLIAAIMQFPTVLYNIELYQNFGHVNFVLLPLFGQSPEVWSIAPGHSDRSLSHHVLSFAPYALRVYFWGTLLFAFVGSIYFLYRQYKKRSILCWPPHAGLVALTFLIFALMFLVIGVETRFLAMLSPFFAILIAAFLHALWRRVNTKYIQLVVFVAFTYFILLLLFSINTFFVSKSIGPNPTTYASVNKSMYNWGYSDLEDFLLEVLDQKIPSYSFSPNYEFLQRTIEDSTSHKIEQEYSDSPIIIIYDQNISHAPEHWIFDRLHVFDGWPVFTTEEYVAFVEKNGADTVQNMNAQYYFVVPEESVLLKDPKRLTDTAKKFESALTEKNLKPIHIVTRQGTIAFRVYTWD